MALGSSESLSDMISGTVGEGPGRVGEGPLETGISLTWGGWICGGRTLPDLPVWVMPLSQWSSVLSKDTLMTSLVPREVGDRKKEDDCFWADEQSLALAVRTQRHLPCGHDPLLSGH